MDVPLTPEDDLLALPARARLFRALGELRRPGTTQELADRVGRHPNTVRTQLQILADAGLLERRTAQQRRGRPRDEWAIAPDAKPAGHWPLAYANLSRWLARAAGDLEAIERAGREIGRELAPETPRGSTADSMHDALASMGFAPHLESTAPERPRFVLRTCPYREAVRENQPAICRLHKGITAGLLDRLDPHAKLSGFVPKDPYAAGCIIALEGVAHAEIA
jgi:predicted ArsR family transcriptional regulator